MAQAPQSCGTSRYSNTSLTPIGNLFDRLLGTDAFAPFTSGRSNLPLATWQDEHNLYVEIDAPGVKPDDVNLSVHNKDLTVSWERASARREDGVDTRNYGKFEQQFRLPVTADESKVQATLTNGVLQLQVPKTEQAKPRKIEVKTA